MERQPSKEGELEPKLFGKTAEQWHAQLTGDNLDVPASRYGRNASEVAWWAVASLYIFDAYTGEPQDMEHYAEEAMSQVVNDHESFEHFVKAHPEYVPASVRAHLTIDGQAVEGGEL